MGSIPGLGRSPGEHGNPLQYSCLENPMDRGAWQATYRPWGSKQLYMTEATQQETGCRVAIDYEDSVPSIN